jgi:glutamate/tyrosine decarboxylase-like PLP-dependent enzyme
MDMKYLPIMNMTLELLSDFMSDQGPGVGPRISPLALKESFDFSLPSEGLPLDTLKNDVKKYLKFTPVTTSPHFQNQLFSGLNPYALAAEWVSTFTNSTMATFEVAPVATLMENELIDHLNKKMGWSDGQGIMVTGGSNANFLAMLVARNTKFPKTKIEGIKNLPLVAFVSEEAHYSFDKAVNMLGMGLDSLRKVPSDPHGRIIPSELLRLIDASILKGEIPYFIGATAGTTVLGAYDSLPEINAIAQARGLWLHVDGAWGGSVILSSSKKYLLDGIVAADSMTLDTHKMLGTGLMSSFFLTRHKDVLRNSNHSGGGDYIFHDSNTSAWDTGPSSLQCGRRVDSFKVWLMWRSLGDKGLEKIIDQMFLNVQVACEMIQASPELELLHDPQMLNVCFKFKPGFEQISLARERLLSEGEFYVNISSRKGETFFRMILVHPELNPSIIQKTLQHIIKSGLKS